MPFPGCSLASPACGGQPRRITRGLWLRLAATGEPQKKLLRYFQKRDPIQLFPVQWNSQQPGRPQERRKVRGRLRISFRLRAAQAQSMPIKLRRFEQVICRFRRPLLRFSKKESKGNARVKSRGKSRINSGTNVRWRMTCGRPMHGKGHPPLFPSAQRASGRIQAKMELRILQFKRYYPQPAVP